jgi:hypothetical protein
VNPDSMEFLIIVVGAILIVGVVYEVAKIIMRHKERR